MPSEWSMIFSIQPKMRVTLSGYLDIEAIRILVNEVRSRFFVKMLRPTSALRGLLCGKTLTKGEAATKGSASFNIICNCLHFFTEANRSFSSGAVCYSAMSTDIRAILNYIKDDGTRPWLYDYQRTEKEIKNSLHKTDIGGTYSEVEVLVRDGRLHSLSLNVNAFELVQQTTSLSNKDFYENPDKIIDIYYPEIAETIKKATGAKHVHVFHHQIRNSKRVNADGSPFGGVMSYAMGIHSDSCPSGAENVFKEYAFEEGTKQFRKGRFLYINAWRNISDIPIANNHLAVCDETSLVKPDDYIMMDYFMRGFHTTQFMLSDRHSEQHRWYYFSKMKKDEVLLFKQWDSDFTLSGRLCFHTAFSDPNAPKDSPARESIEVRAMAYFPEHEPNTCPSLKEEQVNHGPVDEKRVQKGLKKVIEAVEWPSLWSSSDKDYVRAELAKGPSGIKTVAKMLVSDEGNYVGIEKFSKAEKARILTLLYENEIEKKLKKNFLK